MFLPVYRNGKSYIFVFWWLRLRRWWPFPHLGDMCEGEAHRWASFHEVPLVHCGTRVGVNKSINKSSSFWEGRILITAGSSARKWKGLPLSGLNTNPFMFQSLEVSLHSAEQHPLEFWSELGATQEQNGGPSPHPQWGPFENFQPDGKPTSSLWLGAPTHLAGDPGGCWQAWSGKKYPALWKEVVEWEVEFPDCSEPFIWLLCPWWLPSLCQVR